MQKIWQLQEAKARLSEVVRAASEYGPQRITLRGEVKVVVVAYKEYKKLKIKKPGFVELMQKSPLVGLDLNFKRDKSSFREVDL